MLNFLLFSLLYLTVWLKNARALADEIDYDMLVQNLTLYNGSDSGNLFVRDRNMRDTYQEQSLSDETEVWIVLGGLALFTIILSVLIIFGTILSNKNIIRR